MGCERPLSHCTTSWNEEPRSRSQKRRWPDFPKIEALICPFDRLSLSGENVQKESLHFLEDI